MKKLIVYLIGLILLSSVALAAQQTPPYPASFWVNGTLVQGAAPGLSGYKAVVYKVSGKPADGYAFNLSDASGNFRIDPIDDLRMLDNTVHLVAGDYYFGVVAKGNFGINEKKITLVADPDLKNGYYNITDANVLTLKAGKPGRE
jgi:hypothetical protein